MQELLVEYLGANASSNMLKALVAGVALLNFKNLPGVWHVRIPWERETRTAWASSADWNTTCRSEYYEESSTRSTSNDARYLRSTSSPP